MWHRPMLRHANGSQRSGSQSYSGCVEGVRRGFVKGWCASRTDFHRSVTVTVERNGAELARGPADIFRSDLWEHRIGTGRHGFLIKVPGLRSLDGVEVYPSDSATPLARIAKTHQNAVLILQGRAVVQTFVAEADYLSSISLMVAASGGGGPSSRISFSLQKIGSGASPQLIFKLDEDAEAFGENEYFDLFFSPVLRSKGELFTLTISSSDALPDNAATIILDDGPSRITGHLDCVVGAWRRKNVGLVAQVNYSPPQATSPVPQRILYSPVSQCNLNCVHCISRGTRSAPHRLSDDIRDEIRSWCRRGLINYIYTDYSGDILWADDRWGREIDFLVDLDVPFHVDTNGSHLTLDRGLKLIRSKMSSLNVSLDAAKPETYKRIRKGSPPLDSVLKNVHDFAELRKKEDAVGRIRLSLGFTMMRSNIEELNDFIEIGSRLGTDRIECRHVEAYTSDMATESLLFYKERFNEIRLAAVELAAQRGIALGIGEPLEERLSRPGHRFCMAPWTVAVILGSGDVQVCCTPKTKIGSLREQTMEQLWNGDAYKAFRAAVNSDKSPACCNSCAMSRRPGNIQSYLPFQTINEWLPPNEWQT
jgi:MoaA/NifB/PqqE/SkfB family radical SAM enzyme